MLVYHSSLGPLLFPLPFLTIIENNLLVADIDYPSDFTPESANACCVLQILENFEIRMEPNCLSLARIMVQTGATAGGERFNLEDQLSELGRAKMKRIT